jgi:hypothetical protein
VVRLDYRIKEPWLHGECGMKKALILQYPGTNFGTGREKITNSCFIVCGRVISYLLYLIFL